MATGLKTHSFSSKQLRCIIVYAKREGENEDAWKMVSKRDKTLDKREASGQRQWFNKGLCLGASQSQSPLQEYWYHAEASHLFGFVAPVCIYQVVWVQMNLFRGGAVLVPLNCALNQFAIQFRRFELVCKLVQ